MIIEEHNANCEVIYALNTLRTIIKGSQICPTGCFQTLRLHVVLTEVLRRKTKHILLFILRCNNQIIHVKNHCPHLNVVKGCSTLAAVLLYKGSAFHSHTAGESKLVFLKETRLVSSAAHISFYGLHPCLVVNELGAGQSSCFS